MKGEVPGDLLAGISRGLRKLQLSQTALKPFLFLFSQNNQQELVPSIVGLMTASAVLISFIDIGTWNHWHMCCLFRLKEKPIVNVTSTNTRSYMTIMYEKSSLFSWSQISQQSQNCHSLNCHTTYISTPP